MSGPVICGIDRTGTATAAIPVARGLAGTYGLPLLYVYVGGNCDGGAGRTLAEIDPGESYLELSDGHPADQLVALAAERQATFLVVGCHGPRSSLLGSISADVSRRAPCPVVVVPPTATAAGERVSAEASVSGDIVRLGRDRTARRVA